jgi:hypothetical protein
VPGSDTEDRPPIGEEIECGDLGGKRQRLPGPTFATAVASRSDDVTPAAAARATNGDAVEPGWSPMHSASKPSASARRARSTQSEAVAG